MTPVESLEELKEKRWYLASPYRNYEAGRHRAYMDVLDVSERLRKANIFHYCPIVASHEWADIAGIDPVDNAIWTEINWPWMGRCHGLLIAGMLGWERSEGIICEKRVFVQQKKPIRILSLGLIGLKTAA